MITLEHISHSFLERQQTGKGTPKLVPVLDDVTFEVDDGEFIAIVGPSGCGKSTILNALVGDVRPDRGTITLGGRPIGPETRDRTGYMFARDGLLPWRTARQNVALARELRRGRKGRGDPIIDGLLDLAGLADFKNYYPWQLSHGMRQRVALCRTLAREPEVLLMDEPFSGLDAQTRTVVGQQVAEICRESGKTVVFVTHDLLEAIGLGDRVFVFSARPARILHEYKNPLPRTRDITKLRLEQVADLHNAIWEDLRSQLDLPDKDT